MNGQNEKALSEYQVLVKENPENSAILENYINLLMFNQKFEDADAQFKILSQKFPDNKNLQELEEKINSKLDKSSEIPSEHPPL